MHANKILHSRPVSSRPMASPSYLTPKAHGHSPVTCGGVRVYACGIFSDLRKRLGEPLFEIHIQDDQNKQAQADCTKNKKPEAQIGTQRDWIFSAL